MLVPSIVIALFTKILKDKGYIVDLFDTTHYVSEENSSPQNRVKYLQARKFSDTDDLGIKIKTDLIGDFREKVKKFRPDIMIFSVVEVWLVKTGKIILGVLILSFGPNRFEPAQISFIRFCKINSCQGPGDRMKQFHLHGSAIFEGLV